MFNPQMLSALLAARQAGGAGTGATGTGSSDDAVGQASSQLQGADPSFGVKRLMAIKKEIAAMITQYAFRVPGASRALSSCLKGIDSSMKEMQQALATQQAVGGPIALSAIPQPAPPGAIGAQPPQGAGQ